MNAAFVNIGTNISEGSKISVFLASYDNVKNISGKYSINIKSTPTSEISYNENLWKKLWDKSEEFAKFNNNYN